MLAIRLQRVGRKNDPSFRVVVVNSREAAQSGKAIEILGSHDARNSRTELKGERIKYWLSVGAQISPTVNNLLVKNNILAGKTVDVSSKKLGKKATAAVEAKKAAEEKAAKALADKERAEAEAQAVAQTEAEKPVEEVKEETVAETA